MAPIPSKRYEYLGYEITLSLKLAREVVVGSVYDPGDKVWLHELQTESAYPSYVLDTIKAKIDKREDRIAKFLNFINKEGADD